MAHSLDEWHDVLQQLMPRGKAWPRDQTAALTSLLRGFSGRLNAVENHADLLVKEMRPETTELLLEEWEDYLGLPDCNAMPDGFERRRDAVVEKYHRRGGLAPWQIEQAVKDALGFTIEVTEILPHHVMRNIMYPIYSHKYRFIMQVTVTDMPMIRFKSVSNVLTPLISYQAQILECFLRRYRLAGHDYDFLYEV
ncbi:MULTISPECIES: YmfQ family protein [Serratia]|uniref:YmfQ family protein n=1 Tax=Serratia TaxID=613 RepID=UPI001865B816|nr:MULTISPECIES: YmfQ family protein [Serratia]MDQ7097430.1 YmfQ family protein [Serratia sp. MF2]MDQ7104867.1 YmfQ family protein [Serratia sp. MF1(2023)]